MASERYPGFIARLTARTIEAGYVRERDGRPDAFRLAQDLKTSSANVYRWFKGMVPEQWLPDLAALLKTTPEYLLFGSGERRASDAVIPLAESVSRPQIARLPASLDSGLRADIERHLTNQVELLERLGTMAAELAAIKERVTGLEEEQRLAAKVAADNAAMLADLPPARAARSKRK